MKNLTMSFFATFLTFSAISLGMTSKIYANQTDLAINSNGAKRSFTNNRSSSISVDYIISGLIGMSRDQRGPVDPNGYMQNGKPFSSGGPIPVVYMRMSCNGSTRYWTRIQTPFGYVCQRPSGNSGQFLLPAGQTVEFWVKDSNYKDNSGVFQLTLDW